MKLRTLLILIASLALVASSCQKKLPVPEEDKLPEEENLEEELDENTKMTYYYVNQFTYNALSMYYLWISDIEETDAFKNWKTVAEPVSKVEEVRYKDPLTGKDIDRWTVVTDDIEKMSASFDGTSKSYGYDVILYYESKTSDNVIAVVTYTYPGSPAEKAGLERGDVISKVNGITMTRDNYYDLVNKDMFDSETCTLGTYDGRTLSMNAISMYEEPVLVYKVFSSSGKKVGYLHYTAFTLKSCGKLHEVFKYFKSEGISELILDLRYNGGGYVMTEEFLASMIAPPEVVSAGNVYHISVYNELLTSVWGEEKSNFSTLHSIKSDDGNVTEYNALEANPGVRKVYALVSSGSASASESLLVGLIPYMDVEIIGSQTHGKFCSGVLMELQEWYETNKKYFSTAELLLARSYARNWGMYVMIARFADKNGETPCMPSGFVPDVECDDNPEKGTELGNENEQMLALALQRAGILPSTKSVRGIPQRIPLAGQIHHSPCFGKRIMDWNDVPSTLKLAQ